MSERESYQSQVMGKKKYREMISKDSKRTDGNTNLPYTISKPSKMKPLKVHLLCGKCENGYFVSEDTLIAICGYCKHFNRVKSIKKKEL